MKNLKRKLEWEDLTHEEKLEESQYFEMNKMREEHIWEGQLEERQNNEDDI